MEKERGIGRTGEGEREMENGRGRKGERGGGQLSACRGTGERERGREERARQGEGKRWQSAFRGRVGERGSRGEGGESRRQVEGGGKEEEGEWRKRGRKRTIIY